MFLFSPAGPVSAAAWPSLRPTSQTPSKARAFRERSHPWTLAVPRGLRWVGLGRTAARYRAWSQVSQGSCYLRMERKPGTPRSRETPGCFVRGDTHRRDHFKGHMGGTYGRQLTTRKVKGTRVALRSKTSSLLFTVSSRKAKRHAELGPVLRVPPPLTPVCLNSLFPHAFPWTLAGVNPAVFTESAD